MLEHALGQQILKLFFAVKVLPQLTTLLSYYSRLHLIYGNELFHLIVNAHSFQHDYAVEEIARHSVLID